MLLSGFTFIRNALKYDFPIRECVESMLPLVDELVINVGKSEDETDELIEKLRALSPKIRIVRSVWDDGKTDRGLVLSEQTNIALDACEGRWALYLQADEALHEDEHAAIRAAVEAADRESDPPEGLRLRYLHFYGGYSLVQRPWNWYPSEIRVVRRASGARSYGDAQTFRGAPDHRELRTRLLDAHVFHYGHARAPELMQRKIRYFHRFWHGDEHGIDVAGAYDLEWENLVWYWGTHPKPYAARVEAGRAWSPAPASAAKESGWDDVLIYASTAREPLARALEKLIREHRPKARVWIARPREAGLPRELDPSHAAFVDLEAEERGLFRLAAKWLQLRRGYRVTLADVPTGALSGFRARLYDRVSWSCHQTADQGFQVPSHERAKQLGRWLGIDC